MSDFDNVELLEDGEKEPTKDVDIYKQNGIYIHEFKIPFKYDEKIYEKIIFDFAKLTGKDMLDIENEMTARGEFVMFTEFSRNYLCNMCAKASKIGADILTALPMRDFNKIMSEARNFLLGTGY